MYCTNKEEEKKKDNDTDGQSLMTATSPAEHTCYIGVIWLVAPG